MIDSFSQRTLRITNGNAKEGKNIYSIFMLRGCWCLKASSTGRRWIMIRNLLVMNGAIELRRCLLASLFLNHHFWERSQKWKYLTRFYKILSFSSLKNLLNLAVNISQLKLLQIKLWMKVFGYNLIGSKTSICTILFSSR